MKNVRIALSFFSIAAFVLIASSFAQAQNNRSWVSSTGDDTAACTRAAPCRTYQRAVNQTNQQGEVDTIDAAEYGNNVSNVGAISATSTLTISKSVTIDGNGLAFITGGNGSTPNADAVLITTTDAHDVVTIRKLSINGAHFGGVPSAFFEGINFTGSQGALVIERLQISNFSEAGIFFRPTTSGQLFVRDSDLTNNEFFGVRARGGTGLALCSIDNVRVNNNGIFGTGSGIVMEGNTKSNVSDATSAYNGLVGIQAFPTAGSTFCTINVESTVIVGNNINLQSGFSAAVATIRISNVDIFDATANGLAFSGGNFILSFGNNRIAGNIGSNGPPSGTIAQQ